MPGVETAQGGNRGLRYSPDGGRRLRGRIAVVTGSDSGIGQATAVAFAREGADVAVTYLHDREGAELTRRTVEGAGRKALVVRLDQRRPEEVRRLFREVREGLGTPSLLVNNAGIDSTGKHVKDMSDDEWENEMHTNLFGPFYCCREFIRAREGADGRGVIINITSVHQEVPRAGAAGYDVAKGGLRNLTRTLALELAEKGINVVNLSPGWVLTPFNKKAIEDPGYYEEQAKTVPMRRAAEPEEIAAAAVFLASDDARYIHGVTLHVDGGLMQNTGQGA